MSIVSETKTTYPVNQFLEGSYAPVAEERVIHFDEIQVEGTMPQDLNGVYVLSLIHI